MALTAKQKRTLRRVFPDRKASAAVIARIDGGSSSAMSQRLERVVWSGFGRKKKAAPLLAALEVGTPFTAVAAKRSLGIAVGRRKPTADDIVNQINAGLGGGGGN